MGFGAGGGAVPLPDATGSGDGDRSRGAVGSGWNWGGGFDTAAWEVTEAGSAPGLGALSRCVGAVDGELQL